MPVNRNTMSDRCQLFRTLWTHDPTFREWAADQGGVRLESQDLEVHHIFYGSSRVNRKANELRICQVVHRWIHQNKAAGTIAALWKQKQLGKLDWDVLDECRDKRRKGCARGWVEAQRVSGVYAVMQKELLG